jgi:hypothetical protein
MVPLPHVGIGARVGGTFVVDVVVVVVVVGGAHVS